VGLAPAGKLASPFARIDQRLNLFVQWGTPLGRGTLLPNAADAGAEHREPVAEGTAPTAAISSVRQATESLPVLRREAPPTSREAPLPGREPSPPHAESRQPLEKPTELVPVIPPERKVLERAPVARGADGDRSSPEGALPAARPVVTPAKPSAARAPRTSGEPARPRKPERPPNELPERGTPPAIPAEPKRSRRETEAPVTIPEKASDPNVALAFQEALDRVNAWISKGSGDESGPSRVKSEPVAPPPDVTRERAVPAVFTPPATPTVIAPARERRMSLPTRVKNQEETPRLTIGSIEVRVVPPNPPPVVVHPRREPTRVVSAAPQSSARLPSHLTFGMRQR
jgi:hypothetical protein